MPRTLNYLACIPVINFHIPDLLIVAFPRQVMKLSLAETIPPEPPADCTDVMSRLRFRCPDGQMKQRRFLGSTTLHVLLNYLMTEGYRKDEYKVLTTFPRRDVSGYN